MLKLPPLCRIHFADVFFFILKKHNETPRNEKSPPSASVSLLHFSESAW